MCGICGWVDFDGGMVTRADTVRAMTATMRQRGPDDGGVWLSDRAALGHRRLAVIDPAGGTQPMTYRLEDDREVVLVYSGEVYNHRELRVQLTSLGHAFTTSSDTEVVLRAYVQWGDGLAERIDGMFAFAVWDERYERLLLVRDRLGIKPLYYRRTPTGVVFGSEPKAILASATLRPAIDSDGAHELLSLVRTPGRAVLRGMHEMLPGHVMSVGRGGVTTRRYWALEAKEHTSDPRTTVDTVRTLLEDIVEHQLDADVPLCVMLSGGLDSSTLSALASRTRRERGDGPVRTFAVSFVAPDDATATQPLRDGPDTPFVHTVVDRIGSEHTDLTLDVAHLLADETWRATLRARDLPPVGEPDTSLYLMAQTIRDHATVALSGEGADELFGGYPWFHDRACVSASTFPWLAMARSTGHAAVFEPRPVPELDIDTYLGDTYAAALARVPRLAGEDRFERRMREISHLHLTRFLPIALDRKDRMSMAVGLEVRVPYCAHRLVEYVFNVPWSMKAADGVGKALLRHAVTELLPHEVVHRRKNPFPSTHDPAYHVALRTRVKDLLADRDAPVFGLVRRPSIRALAGLPPSGLQIVWMGLERVLRISDWLTTYDVSVEV